MIKRFVEFCNPIEYSNNGEFEIVAKGTIYDFDFYVTNCHTPCAYIKIPEGHPYFGKKKVTELNISCHGGLTFSDRKLKIQSCGDLTGWFIGWDYAHFPRDYVPSFANENGKKWKTEEIIKECESVIRQLIEVEK